jgi:hypothetical protein
VQPPAVPPLPTTAVGPFSSTFMPRMGWAQPTTQDPAPWIDFGLGNLQAGPPPAWGGLGGGGIGQGFFSPGIPNIVSASSAQGVAPRPDLRGDGLRGDLFGTAGAGGGGLPIGSLRPPPEQPYGTYLGIPSHGGPIPGGLGDRDFVGERGGLTE